MNLGNSYQRFIWSIRFASTTQFEMAGSKYKVICGRQRKSRERIFVITCQLKYMKNAFSILILIGDGWVSSYILP